MVLPNRAIADVRVDSVNVRAAGNPSAEILGQLRAGARVFTIGAPEELGDAYWYRVAIVSSGSYTADDCGGSDSCVAGIGWVASPITGDPWLEEVEVGCPGSPMTAQDLARLSPLERLHCYASSDIVVTGMLDGPFADSIGPVRYDPMWLAFPGGGPFFRDVDRPLHVRVDPASGLEPPTRGQVIEAVGHFDDPAAVSCRQFIDPEYEPEVSSDGLPPRAEVILVCRAELVISEYRVIDSVDLGPVGWAAP